VKKDLFGGERDTCGHEKAPTDKSCAGRLLSFGSDLAREQMGDAFAILIRNPLSPDSPQEEQGLMN